MLPVRVGVTRPTTVNAVPLMVSVWPALMLLVEAYAVLTRTWSVGVEVNQLPDTTWEAVMSPVVRSAGSTAAAVYVLVCVSVAGGLSTRLMVWVGTTTWLMYCWRRCGRHCW